MVVCVHAGLVDTAVKTAETGYMQRRLVKVCECMLIAVFVHLHLSRDCVVRDKRSVLIMGGCMSLIYGVSIRGSII